MAKRKISNKRSSRYSRGSNGSNVLNPDTNIFDDEQPYWWRNLENNTIVTRSTNSANFNQTSRRLDPNSSIESNNGLDDGWWKVLEGTPRNLKSQQKGNDLSKKDANDGASRISESEEEVKIAKKKPQLRPVAKKVDGNAFLCALKDPRVLLIPLEKDISIAQRFLSTSQISNDSKQPNKDSDTKLRMTEHGNDLFNCPLPKATSTPLEGSIASHGSSVGNSNSDTELILKKKKPKSKLLRRHNRDTKKNLFEDILMEEDQTEVEEAAHQPSANASAVVDESAKEREPRIVENKSKLEDANQRLHPTEKADHQDSGNNSSDTTYEFLQPTKPKTRFLRQTGRTPRENLFQRILSDSDSPTTKATSNLSQNRNSTQTVRRPSVISTESNEDVNLKLSNSSNSSDVDIIRTRNNVVSSSPDKHVEIASSPPEDRIFDAVRTSRERSVLSNENAKDRNVSHSYRTQLFSDSDEEEDDKASDVTLLTMASKSLSVKTRSTISSEITTQPEVHLTQQSQENSAAYEEAVASQTKGSVVITDSAAAENAYDASDIEFRDLNRSRKRSISRRDQEIAAEEAAMSQRSMKSQKHASSANFNEDRTSSEVELLSRSSIRGQSKRSTTAQQRISSTVNDGQTSELDTSRQSKKFKAARRTSERENVRTPERKSRDAVKDSKFRDLNRSRTRSMSRGAQEIVAEEAAMSQRSMKSQKHTSPANINEDRTSSEEELLSRSSQRWQSKRSTTAQQRIASTANDKQPRELDTPRRSKRSEAVQRTSETENVRTFEQEQSSPANFNEERTSSEAERSPRTSLRRQSKRSTTAQQRISSTASDEQPRELDTPRRSKRSEAGRRTSETESVRTPEKESRDAVKDSKFRDLNRSRTRSMSRGAQEIVAEETAMSTMKSQGRSSPANFNEDRTSSEAEPSARTSLGGQGKRSTTAQQRISSTAIHEQPRELENLTPRRSKRTEAVRRTSETVNVRTLEKESGDAVKDSEFRDLNRSRDRSMSRNAQEIAAEESATSQSPMKSQGRSSPANLNEDRTSSEVGLSARTSLRWQSKRSTTAQQRISSTANDGQTRELDTPRRSKRSEAIRRTSETENVRTPERQSRGAVKDSEFRDLNTSRDRSMSRGAQEIAAEKTAMSTMESQDRSSTANFNEDRLSSEGTPSTSITAQQRISFTPNDGQTRELGNITPRRSKRSEAVRRTSEKENVRTPEKESWGAVKDSELEGTLQSRRSRHNLIEEAEETPPLYRPGSGKARSSAAPPRGQKVLEDFFKTNATAIPASEALSDPQMAQEIRKKLDEMKKRELQKMEEIGKLAVAEKKKKSGKGLRPKPNQPDPVPKKVDKAYLVNGVVYKRPRLPRPKKWVTDHLYRYLWKQMEPTYKLETRVQSENFIRRLSEVCDVILKRKTYETYKDLLYALMKEMARLQIISTRFDFYNFCHDFLPYELRAKMVPILLPGNMRTIPYNPQKLYDPLISP